MPWHLVIVDKVDVTAADMSASALITDFARESGAAVANPAVEVWHRRETETTHRYYFSPEAARCAPATLANFRSSPVSGLQKPDFDGFTKILL
jgi:hypothetical protein